MEHEGKDFQLALRLNRHEPKLPLRSRLANENLPLRGICLGETRRLHRTHALDILGFKPFVAGDDLKRDFVAFIQVLNPGPVMDV